MIKSLKRLWAAAPVATAILLVATLFMAGFGLRLALHAWLWRAHPPREEMLAPWMTPGFVAHNWHLPREVMIEGLALPEAPPKKRMSLKEIADEMGIPEAELMQRVQDTIDSYRAAHPPPLTGEPMTGAEGRHDE
ncbi:hypothetical protein [Celeribacter neptunius]|uniref:Uncharacterized protein n=1 Tax=Celeribacter neptunius TaxID=588602 RepID=A0A1I3LWW8_9RHOB|nr:hypothetical protein [Celeribacter neptunius]SFI89274.1 hypothetical protein SAMN04487991_1170 [Celeribacter neptunius]